MDEKSENNTLFRDHRHDVQWRLAQEEDLIT
jgi:hypothetical protein